jgi:hemin uptake protein HemP
MNEHPILPVPSSSSSSSSSSASVVPSKQVITVPSKDLKDSKESKDTAEHKKEVEAKANAAKSASLLAQINEILVAHGGNESNVGQNSEYWDLLKQYRLLNINP